MTTTTPVTLDPVTTAAVAKLLSAPASSTVVDVSSPLSSHDATIMNVRSPQYAGSWSGINSSYDVLAAGVGVIASLICVTLFGLLGLANQWWLLGAALFTITAIVTVTVAIRNARRSHDRHFRSGELIALSWRLPRPWTESIYPLEVDAAQRRVQDFCSPDSPLEFGVGGTITPITAARIVAVGRDIDRMWTASKFDNAATAHQRLWDNICAGLDAAKKATP